MNCSARPLSVTRPSTSLGGSHGASDLSEFPAELGGNTHPASPEMLARPNGLYVRRQPQKLGCFADSSQLVRSLTRGSRRPVRFIDHSHLAGRGMSCPVCRERSALPATLAPVRYGVFAIASRIKAQCASKTACGTPYPARRHRTGRLITLVTPDDR